MTSLIVLLFLLIIVIGGTHFVDIVKPNNEYKKRLISIVGYVTMISLGMAAIMALAMIGAMV